MLNIRTPILRLQDPVLTKTHLRVDAKSSLQQAEKEWERFQVTPEGTVKRQATLNTGKGMSHAFEVSLK